MNHRPGWRGSLFSLAARAAIIAATLVVAAVPAAEAQAQTTGDPSASASAGPSAAPEGTPAQQQPGPVMKITPGFHGMAKIGDWVPVTIDVSNDGPGVTGRIEVETSDSAGPGARVRSFTGRPNTTYAVEATVPSHSRKQYQIDVFLPTIVDTVTAKLVTDQGVLVEQKGSLQALSGSDVLCGTLSRNQDFFQQLTNLDLPGRPGKKPFIAALTPADLPNSLHALSSLDCLILNNVSLSGLTADQKVALQGWVEGGGLLVLGGGTGWQKTIQPLPKDLVPVNVTGVRTVQSLKPLADFAQQPFKGDGPWLVTAGAAVNATTVVQTNGTPLLVGARRGKGDVIFLAVDPTAEPMDTWPGNAALWKYIMAYNSTPLTVFPFFGAFGGFNSAQNWGVPPRTAMYNVAGVELPSQSWLLLLAGIYALVAGPLNFLALTLMGRRELGFVTVPILILVGTLLAFRMAQGSRGSDIVMNKISIVRSDGNSAIANVRSYVALYTPRKATYELAVPGTAVVSSFAAPSFPQPNPRQPGQAAPPPWKLLVNEADTSTRVELPLDEASTGTFFSDSQVRLNGGFDSSLQVQGSSIAGAITNHTGETVDDVLLTLGANVVHLGTMRDGETKGVKFVFDPNAVSSGPDPTAVKGSLDGRGQSSSTMSDRQSVLDAFLGANSTQPAGLSGLTLMGWLTSSPLPIQIDGWNPSIKATSLYVTPLPLTFARAKDLVIPPSLVETSQIGTFSSSFQRTGQYELNPGGSVALQFALPRGADAMASQKLVLQVNGHYSGVGQGLSSRQSNTNLQGTPGAPLGQIFVYNWQTSNWDALDLAWGPNAVDQPAPYLSAINTMRVRFTYKAPARFPTASIQFSLDLSDQGEMK